MLIEDVLMIVALSTVALFVAAFFLATRTPKKRGAEEKAAAEPTIAIDKVLTGAQKPTIKPESVKEASEKLKALKMERDFLADFVTRVYEARNKGALVGEDTEALAKEYGNRLKSIDEKMARHESLVELYNLERERGKILSNFVGNYLSVDRKIAELRSRLKVEAKPPTKKRPTARPPKKRVKRRVKGEETAEEEVRRLMREIESEMKKLEEAERD